MELRGHDGFFKKAMSRKRVAKEFLTHLPDEIRKKIDLESVEKQDSQFLSNILGKGISDVLFKVHSCAGEEEKLLSSSKKIYI